MNAKDRQRINIRTFLLFLAVIGTIVIAGEAKALRPDIECYHNGYNYSSCTDNRASNAAEIEAYSRLGEAVAPLAVELVVGTAKVAWWATTGILGGVYDAVTYPFSHIESAPVKSTSINGAVNRRKTIQSIKTLAEYDKKGSQDTNVLGHNIDGHTHKRTVRQWNNILLNLKKYEPDMYKTKSKFVRDHYDHMIKEEYKKQIIGHKQNER